MGLFGWVVEEPMPQNPRVSAGGVKWAGGEFQTPDAMISTTPTPDSEHRVIRRRGVLGTMGLAGLGVLASSAKVGAFTSGKPSAGPQVAVPTATENDFYNFSQAAGGDALPAEWVAWHGPLTGEYLRYLNTLGLRRICPKQVLTTHAHHKGSVWNTLPPKAWWNRIGYTLRVVERIAREMNVSQVEVISAYRCPQYNALCPGAKSGSWHQANIAADVKFPVKASKVTATARELRDLGLFKGGVGGYWNFTHIDCRGQNVNW